jgi:serine/threonine protein kinase
MNGRVQYTPPAKAVKKRPVASAPSVLDRPRRGGVGSCATWLTFLPMHVCPICSTANDPAAQTCAECGRALPLPSGTLVASRFEVLESIGSGGMGIVYRARDRTLDEMVALKVLRTALAAGDELARRFRSEIKLARRVGHRNVCRVFEYGEDGPVRYIAMELVDGVNLRHLVKHAGPLPISEAFDVVIQAASGLEAIHELGVVHRDLKSANIMRTKRGVVKLMDFGIARHHLESSDVTATGVIVGTPEYMSPEQASGEKVDARSDIYSLGIVIHEVFTGVVPFKGDTPVATILKHLQEPLALENAPELPAAVGAILTRCLAKLPKQRYASATELRLALEEARDQVISGGPTDRRLAVDLASSPHEAITHTTLRPSLPAVTVKPSSTPTRHAATRAGRRVWAAGIVALVVVVGATALYRWLARPAATPALPTPAPSPVQSAETPLALPTQSAAATPTPARIASVPRSLPSPAARPPVPDEASQIAAQLDTLNRLAEVDVEGAYTRLLVLASQHPDSRAIDERLRTQRQRLSLHWIARGREALGQATSGSAAEPYERALGYFDKALELDPANADAQSGRAAAARGPSRPVVPRDRVAFVQGDTRFTASPMANAPPGMGQLPPGVAVRSAQPPAPQARIVIEVDPQQLRVGDAYVARYYVFNQSQSPLSLAGASVRNSLGSDATTGGRIELKSKLAPPGTRTLLLETRDTWRNDPSAAWSTTLTLMLEDGSVYSGTLHTQR